MAFNPPAFAAAVAKLEANPPNNALAFANGWADAFFNGFETQPLHQLLEP